MPDETSQAAKPGSFETLVTQNGDEVEVVVLENGPAAMVVKVIDTGQVLCLAKAVQ